MASRCITATEDKSVAQTDLIVDSWSNVLVHVGDKTKDQI